MTDEVPVVAGLVPCPKCSDCWALQDTPQSPPLLARTVRCGRCGFSAPYDTWQSRADLTALQVVPDAIDCADYQIGIGEWKEMQATWESLTKREVWNKAVIQCRDVIRERVRGADEARVNEKRVAEEIALRGLQEGLKERDRIKFDAGLAEAARLVCAYCGRPESFTVAAQIEGSQRYWHHLIATDESTNYQCGAAVIHSRIGQSKEKAEVIRNAVL